MIIRTLTSAGLTAIERLALFDAMRSESDSGRIWRYVVAEDQADAVVCRSSVGEGGTSGESVNPVILRLAPLVASDRAPAALSGRDAVIPLAQPLERRALEDALRMARRRLDLRSPAPDRAQSTERRRTLAPVLRRLSELHQGLQQATLRLVLDQRHAILVVPYAEGSDRWRWQSETLRDLDDIGLRVVSGARIDVDPLAPTFPLRRTERMAYGSLPGLIWTLAANEPDPMLVVPDTATFQVEDVPEAVFNGSLEQQHVVMALCTGSMDLQALIRRSGAALLDVIATLNALHWLGALSLETMNTTSDTC